MFGVKCHGFLAKGSIDFGVNMTNEVQQNESFGRERVFYTWQYFFKGYYLLLPVAQSNIKKQKPIIFTQIH